MRHVKAKKFMYIVHDEFSTHPRIYYSFTTRNKATDWILEQGNAKLLITRVTINPKPVQEDLSKCPSIII